MSIPASVDVRDAWTIRAARVICFRILVNDTRRFGTARTVPFRTSAWTG
jgi:hypothetical protein